MRRIAVLIGVVAVLAACGGGGGNEDSAATSGAEDLLEPAIVDDPASPEAATPPECPLETEDVVAVIGKDVTKEPDSCAWRDAVTLVQAEVFGPGGNGFLDTWRDQFEAEHDEVTELDRGDGGYVGTDDAEAHAYVETNEASYLVFVGSVECFDADQYRQAVSKLIDVILGEPAEPVTATQCPGPATGSVTTSAVAEVTP